MRAIVWMVMTVACTEAPVEAPPEMTKPATPADEAVAAWTQQLVGVWVGEADTPMGTMIFAMEGVERPQGGVRSAIEQMGLAISLVFRLTEEGWRMTERGELPGGFVQEHDLVLVDEDGETTRWTSVDPGLMDIETSIREDTWTFTVDVRGEPHVTWDLERL